MSDRYGGRWPQRGGRSNPPGQRRDPQDSSANMASLRSRISAQHRAAGRAAAQVHAANRAHGRGHGQAQTQTQAPRHAQGRGQINQRRTEPSGQQRAPLLTTAPQPFPATSASHLNTPTPQRVNPLTLRPPVTTAAQTNLPAAPHTRFVTVTIHTAKCDICNKHNTSILRRCATCGWQICTPCWDARGGDGSHGTRRPFRGDTFSSPVQSQQASEGGNEVRAGDTSGTAAQRGEDEEVQALQAALILESMQYARVLRPRQRRNYQEPSLAVPSPIQEEREDENDTGGDADETASEASQRQGNNFIEPNSQAVHISTPSRQLPGPRSADELGLWYLAEAATEVLENMRAEANDIEMEDAPPSPTPRGRQIARGARGHARGRVTTRLRRADNQTARGQQGHERFRDDDREGLNRASGFGPRA